MQNLPKVAADELGYFQLTLDGAVIASRGCLQNDEATAQSVAHFVNVATRDKIWHEGQQIIRLTVMYPTYCYVICQSNKRIHVVKKTVHNSLGFGET